MAQIKDDPLLMQLLSQKPELFGDVLKNRMEWNVQVIYTQIDRDKKGRPHFTDHTFNIIPHPLLSFLLPSSLFSVCMN